MRELKLEESTLCVRWLPGCGGAIALFDIAIPRMRKIAANRFSPIHHIWRYKAWVNLGKLNRLDVDQLKIDELLETDGIGASRAEGLEQKKAPGKARRSPTGR